MSQLKKILVAYDGSSHSKHALNWAIDFSLLSGAQVAAVKVFDGSWLYPDIAETGGKKFPTLLDEIRREDQRLMDEVELMGYSRGVTVKGDILHGNITEQIIKYAGDDNYDLIVVGSRGHGVLGQLLMGSVTRNLVSLSRIPVLVVKG